jgi:hypothetical protein
MKNHPVNASAAIEFGWASPNPHPPSRSWATTGPAHFPELNPQQLEAQSASLVQTPVINCVPGAAGADTGAVAGVATGAVAAPPRSLSAAMEFGAAAPKPHPPSRSWAIMGPAHLPELKPQQLEAQSASLVQTPVMNWVPAVGALVSAAGVGVEMTVTRVVGVWPRSFCAAKSLGCALCNLVSDCT